MRVLFLSHYFPPEVNAPATRAHDHCKSWVQLGHEVTVVTCVPNHPQGQVYPGFKNRLWQVEYLDGIRVIRLWTFITANEGFLKRSLNYLFFMIMCILAAPWLGRADVVLSTSPQFFNGLAGFFVSRLKRAPWVLEIRDLWPDSILAVGATNNRTLINTLYWLEKFAYRQCQHLVVVTDAFKAHIVKLGIDAEKISVIKNGVDLSLFDQGVSVSKAEAAAILGLDAGHFEGKLVAAYVGTHGMAHHLDTILEAAQRLSHDANIVFLMVGEGAEKARLKARQQALGLGNVIMLDQLPKAKMPMLWRLVDVSLVLLKRSPLFETVIPSKIFESMAMGKPIAIGVRGEAQSLVEQAGCGIAIEPENADELVWALQGLAQDPVRYQALSASGIRYVVEHFDRQKLARRFLELLVRLQEPVSSKQASEC